jgi:hypothetical protein
MVPTFHHSVTNEFWSYLRNDENELYREPSWRMRDIGLMMDRSEPIYTNLTEQSIKNN